jgi:hypothetical protein
MLSYHKEKFHIFQAKAEAVVEHHFNNHEHCDDWCRMKNTDAATVARGDLKYRCKKENAELYKQVLEIKDRFVATDKLRDCHHAYSSQKNESMKKCVS